MILSLISLIFGLAFFYFFCAYAKWAWQDRKVKADGYMPHFLSVLSFLLGCVMVYISTLGGIK